MLFIKLISVLTVAAIVFIGLPTLVVLLVDVAFKRKQIEESNR
jgi:hypothetical protein